MLASDARGRCAAGRVRLMSPNTSRTLAAHYTDRLVLPAAPKWWKPACSVARPAGVYLHPGIGSEIKSRDLHFQSSGPGASPRRPSGRMVLLMINEAARCLEEGVVSEPADVDFAMIGHRLRRSAADHCVTRLRGRCHRPRHDRLAHSAASHFAPCDLLRKLATTRNLHKPRGKT